MFFGDFVFLLFFFLCKKNCFLIGKFFCKFWHNFSFIIATHFFFLKTTFIVTKLFFRNCKTFFFFKKQLSLNQKNFINTKKLLFLIKHFWLRHKHFGEEKNILYFLIIFLFFQLHSFVFNVFNNHGMKCEFVFLFFFYKTVHGLSLKIVEYSTTVQIEVYILHSRNTK